MMMRVRCVRVRVRVRVRVYYVNKCCCCCVVFYVRRPHCKLDWYIWTILLMMYVLFVSV